MIRYELLVVLVPWRLGLCYMLAWQGQIRALMWATSLYTLHSQAQSSLNSRTDTSTPANITNTERPAAMPRPSPLQELLSDTVIFAIFFIVSALVFWCLHRQRRKELAKLIDYVPSYTRPQGQGSDSGGASATAGEPAAAAGEECAVCLGALEDGDVCCVLPACRHEFHRECMRQWFMTGKTTCPLCRAKVQQLAVADIV